jgi:hypothetical protein
MQRIINFFDKEIPYAINKEDSSCGVLIAELDAYD